eukprot:CAMPEP_0173291290 /NCGR_PEP_ID=MMETSP1143-20121109/12074_1 /TAXON_ID=483371 /ORGANISM="non described non described, Strain CCMP2298" /LENGTH=108 /DNA_ID=CAMNT_0014230517 /DNA_START=1025 /DNA_END=1351 /DNA_ORIENTATION=-
MRRTGHPCSNVETVHTQSDRQPLSEKRDEVERLQIEARWHGVAHDVKSLVRSIIEHRRPPPQRVAQLKHLPAACRQLKQILVGQERSDGICEWLPAAEEGCPALPQNA